jgi:hypothetical protein
MKGKWLVCALAGLMLLGWSLAAAEDEPAPGEEKVKKAHKRAGRDKPRREKAPRAKRVSPEAAFDYAAVANEMALSDEMKAKLTGLILNQQMLAKLQRAKLAEDQKPKLKDACAAAAKDVLAAADAEGRDAALKALMAKVKTDVLTEEQQKLFGPRERKPKEAKGEGAAEGKRGKRRDKKAEGAEGGAEAGGGIDIE